MSTLDKAIKEANRLHGDKSLSLEETLDQLELLREEVNDLINAVREDIERRDMEVSDVAVSGLGV